MEDALSCPDPDVPLADVIPTHSLSVPTSPHPSDVLMSKVSEVSEGSEVSELMVSSLPSPSPTVSPPPPPLFPGISNSEMSLLQQFCFMVQNLHQSFALKIVHAPISGSELFCDVSTGVLRPLVPEPMRRAVFESIHKVSHPGKRASRKLTSQSFFWEFLSRDVYLWA